VGGYGASSNRIDPHCWSGSAHTSTALVAVHGPYRLADRPACKARASTRTKLMRSAARTIKRAQFDFIQGPLRFPCGILEHGIAAEYLSPTPRVASPPPMVHVIGRNRSTGAHKRRLASSKAMTTSPLHQMASNRDLLRRGRSFPRGFEPIPVQASASKGPE